PFAFTVTVLTTGSGEPVRVYGKVCDSDPPTASVSAKEPDRSPPSRGSVTVTLFSWSAPVSETSIAYWIVSPTVALAGQLFVTAIAGTSLMIALGWMLRSWFLLPLPSRFWVRMCQGAPLTAAAPFGSLDPVTQ